jgi:hypothetical protein
MVDKGSGRPIMDLKNQLNLKNGLSILLLLLFISASSYFIEPSEPVKEMDKERLKELYEPQQEESFEKVIIHDYTFKGESEHWLAEYKVNGKGVFKEERETKNEFTKLTHQSEAKQEFILTYKGSLPELASVKKIEYSYRSSSGGGGSEMNFTTPPDKKVFISSSSSINGAIEDEDDIIEVTVMWDGMAETFELKSDDGLRRGGPRR